MLNLRFVTALLCASLAAALLAPRAALAQTHEERVVLLVANPTLARDPVFSQSVLLVAPGPDGFHVGLIINRPTERTLESLFPAHEPSRSVKGTVFFGGPMSMDALVALVKRKSSPGRDALTLADGLYLAVAADTVDRVIESSPDDARFYVGVVVWQPGELQAELKNSFWTVLEADPKIIFDSDPAGMWKELQSRPRGVSASIGAPTQLAAR